VLCTCIGYMSSSLGTSSIKVYIGCHITMWELLCRSSFLMMLRPPSSPLFPYTTLFRSARLMVERYDLAHRDILEIGCGKGEFLRSEEHTSELQSREKLVCRLLLEKKKNTWYLISIRNI